MEMRNKFLKKLKTSFHFQISRRDLTISDVAFAQQNENKLSFAFAYSQHCIVKNTHNTMNNTMNNTLRKVLQILGYVVATLLGATGGATML